MKVFMTQALEPEGVAIVERVAEVVSPPHLNRLNREEFLSAIADAGEVTLIWHTEMMNRHAFDRAPGGVPGGHHTEPKRCIKIIKNDHPLPP